MTKMFEYILNSNIYIGAMSTWQKYIEENLRNLLLYSYPKNQTTVMIYVCFLDSQKMIKYYDL